MIVLNKIDLVASAGGAALASCKHHLPGPQFSLDGIRPCHRQQWEWHRAIAALVHRFIARHNCCSAQQTGDRDDSPRVIRLIRLWHPCPCPTAERPVLEAFLQRLNPGSHVIPTTHSQVSSVQRTQLVWGTRRGQRWRRGAADVLHVQLNVWHLNVFSGIHTSVWLLSCRWTLQR